MEGSLGKVPWSRAPREAAQSGPGDLKEATRIELQLKFPMRNVIRAMFFLIFVESIASSVRLWLHVDIFLYDRCVRIRSCVVY